MSQSVPYWHVDAFAAEPFSGNQAAVMILEEWPDDSVLQAIGAENNFAETAFLVKDETAESDWQLRWFTPALEIRLCGHATLAAGAVLLQSRFDGDSMPMWDGRNADSVRLQTRKAGILEVRRADKGYAVALPAIPTGPGEFPEAVAALGAEPLEVWRNQDRYNLFLFESEAQVRALSPDFRALAALGNHQFMCTAAGDETDIVSRVFAPGAGVDEDSVTGSAHAVMTPFWADRTGRDRFTAHQASERGGHLACRLDGDRVWLEGQCVTVVEGRFFL